MRGDDKVVICSSSFLPPSHSLVSEHLRKPYASIFVSRISMKCPFLSPIPAIYTVFSSTSRHLIWGCGKLVFATLSKNQPGFSLSVQSQLFHWILLIYLMAGFPRFSSACCRAYQQALGWGWEIWTTWDFDFPSSRAVIHSFDKTTKGIPWPH